ncbi:MAG: hypothetical protein WCG27_06475 [Pseudomonadota bacterium]
MNDFNFFLNRLIYLGGRLSVDSETIPVIYVDLEKFVIDATLFMDIDTRVTTTFIYWLKRYGTLLSPSKIRRIIKASPFNPFVLTVFLAILENRKERQQNWKIIKSFCKKHKKGVELFATSAFISNDNRCPYFQHAKIIYKNTPAEDEMKFLKEKNFILNSCPEIRYRAQGCTQVIADLRAYLNKHELKTLYKAAKETFNPRSRINQSYRFIQMMGI